MGATHSFAGIDDNIFYTVKLYEFMQETPFSGDKKSRHLFSLAHPREGEFWIVDTNGTRITKLVPRWCSISHDASYKFFETEVVDQKQTKYTLRPVVKDPNNAYIYTRVEGGKIKYASVVYYSDKQVERIRQKSSVSKEPTAAPSSSSNPSYKAD